MPPSTPYTAVAYDSDRRELLLLDQTLLPYEEKTLRLSSVDEICEAIYMLRVRGAPSIGVAAAYGLCAMARHTKAEDLGSLRLAIDGAADKIEASRPTAVNLMAAIRRMRPLLQSAGGSTEQLHQALEKEAAALEEEERKSSLAMGRHAFELFEDGDGVITHCNTGALAAPGLGTALGTLAWAQQQGKALHVFVDETRPLLQGGRLTTWECMRMALPCTLIADNMAAVVMREGRVQKAIVGADRIAANGDAANKIGTYGLAVLCKHHDIPFYIAAPFTTVDLNCATGADVPIEQRPAEEMRGAFGVTWAPADVEVYNPAFDVTPAELIAGIVTERGLLRPPYVESLARLAP